MPKTKIKTMEEFTQRVKTSLIAEFPDCTVDVVTVTKNNGLLLSGIIVKPVGVEVAPTVYMEVYFMELQSGRTFDDILEEIISNYKMGLKDITVNINPDKIKDFECIKNKICYRLVNKEMNSELLSTLPHRDFYGLAIIYCIKLPSIDGAVRTIKVTNALVTLWGGVEEEQLYELACRNTPVLERGNVMPLTNVGDIASRLHIQKDRNQQHLSCDGFDITMTGKKLQQIYVTTNMEKVNGACVILYDGLLRTMAEYIGNFYILPSSVHECILAPGDPEDAKCMLSMVQEVNATVVSDEEVLSNNCLYYDAKSHSLKLIE